MDRNHAAEVDPERISHRYHLIRVVVTLSTIGIVTLLIGFTSLADPETVAPLRYFGGCAVVAVVCGLAVFYLLKGGGKTTTTVEAAMVSGLVATYANTIYGGLLGVDPWWQVCGYLVVILIAGGVSLRRWPTFWMFTVAGLVAWALALASSDESRDFVFDSFVLILLGSIVAGAILWLFRIERKRVTALNRELRENATHDPLTGLLNRQGLLGVTLRSTSIRNGPMWCAYVDVDYFKSINDRRGHDHGDDVLRAVADALNGAGSEVTSRWGGDEFVLIGSGEPPSEDSIQERIEGRISEIEQGAAVTVGIATGSVRDQGDLEVLMRKADRRMYARRAAFRNEPPPHSASPEPDSVERIG